MSPRDGVIVEIPSRITKKQAKRIKQKVRRALGTENVLIVAGGEICLVKIERDSIGNEQYD